ncbi:hypothetical protein OUZ56_011356 [Daphnia magna]|uniref:Chromo domain-containing protein n=1 Tax=Daphnia magna TaxID=35525 RepID=A0ABQ9YZW9_9CRUS|nr:hypothetical protein OUZ56_011356 [Daphnia magna]
MDYVVEELLDWRVVFSETGRKKVQYVVKFAGYSDSDNQWVDAKKAKLHSLVRQFNAKRRLQTTRTPEIENDEEQPCSTVTSSSGALETSTNSNPDLNVENVARHLSPEPSSTSITAPSSRTTSLRRTLQPTSTTPQPEQQPPLAGSSGNTACKVKGHTVSSFPIRNRNTEGPTIAPQSSHLIHSMAAITNIRSAQPLAVPPPPLLMVHPFPPSLAQSSNTWIMPPPLAWMAFPPQPWMILPPQSRMPTPTNSFTFPPQ